MKSARKSQHDYPVARGFQPPPGHQPPHRRPAWRLFVCAGAIVLAVFTALGWFVLQGPGYDWLQSKSTITATSDVAIIPPSLAEVNPADPPTPPAKIEEPAKAGANAITFSQVSTLFQSRCLNCHGKQKQKGGLDLRTLDSVLKGGDSGPAIVFGSPAEGLLWQSVRDGIMPPDKIRKLTEKDLDLIKRWIEFGER